MSQLSLLYCLYMLSLLCCSYYDVVIMLSLLCCRYYAVVICCRYMLSLLCCSYYAVVICCRYYAVVIMLSLFSSRYMLSLLCSSAVVICSRYMLYAPLYNCLFSVLMINNIGPEVKLLLLRSIINYFKNGSQIIKKLLNKMS